jgi:hypothetical protein
VDVVIFGKLQRNIQLIYRNNVVEINDFSRKMLKSEKVISVVNYCSWREHLQHKDRQISAITHKISVELFG